MTTSIPKINTLPYDVFASPSASILLPIALGTAVGYSTRRTFIFYQNLPIVNSVHRGFGESLCPKAHVQWLAHKTN
jgi:hypothetical protein